MTLTKIASRLAHSELTSFSLGNGGRGFDTSTIPSFFVRLQTDLLPQNAWGSHIPTFTRATTATQTDFEGKLNAVLSGEARFQGARRVANLAPSTLSAATYSVGSATVATGITDPLGGTTAYRWTATGADDGRAKQVTGLTSGNSMLNTIWVRRAVGTGQVALYTGNSSGGSRTDITASLTSSWQRFSAGVTAATSTTGYIGVSMHVSTDAVDVWRPQMQDVTGQTNQNPAEDVTNGILSAPYYGAGVDGVQYFTTLNGNTVASNVVTEATGATITSAQAAAAGGVTAGVVDASGPLGYLAEGVRINYLLNSGTPATQTTASLATGTYTLWQTGTGSSTSSAGTATITGGGAATAGTPNVFVVTVAGTVTVTVAGSPTTFQLENGAFASSYIPTTTVAVTRNADVLTYPFTNNMAATNMPETVYAEVSISQVATSTTQARSIWGATPAGYRGGFIYDTGAPAGKFGGYHNAAGAEITAPATTVTNGVVAKVAQVYNGTNATSYINGTSGAASAQGAQGAPPFTDINIGASAGSTGQPFGTIRNVRIYPTALSVAKLQVMTT